MNTAWMPGGNILLDAIDDRQVVWGPGGASGFYLDDIQFDSQANSGYQAAASTYTISFTCDGPNGELIVGVAMLSLAQTVTAIDYNGDALTLIGVKNSVSGACRVELWGLVNPDQGTHNISITLSGAIASAAVASSYAGVHQTSPTEAFNSAQATNVGAADATVDVTTVADNDWVVDIVATDDGSITVGSGQVQRGNVTGAGGSGAMSSEGLKTPAGAVTMSWTGVGALATWSIGAVAIRPVAAVSSGTFTVTIIDSLALSDTVLRIANGNRLVTNNLGISDSVARLANAARSISDQLGLTDALSRRADGNRLASEQLGITDLVSRKANAFRSIVESLAISEAFSRIASANRLLSDNLAIGDLVSISLIAGGALLLHVLDTLGISDAVSRRADGNRSLSDNLGLLDSFLRRADGKRLASDNLGISEALARRSDASRSLAESLGVADTVLRIADASRILTDYVGISDLLSILGGLNVAATILSVYGRDDTMLEAYGDI